MADSHTLARPYAQAVFEMAQATGTLEQWSNALGAAAEIGGHDEVQAVIADPKMSEADQVRFLTDLLRSAGESYLLGGENREGTNFLRLLVENDRVGVLPEIAERFDQLKDETENTVDVTVTTAEPISDEQLATIRRALEERLGKRSDITTQTDKDLIGGAVIRAGDFVIDGSVRSRLEKLATALAN